jgi:hypothetical protein
MMHKVDDKVVHLREGLSTIISITEIAGGQYFLLKVHRANCEDIFVPVETANNIIRSILTVEEADGITLDCPSITEIVVAGIDKEKVGQFAAMIRGIREPEPYHGYGIRYSDEVIERKVGKAAGGKG